MGWTTEYYLRSRRAGITAVISSDIHSFRLPVAIGVLVLLLVWETVQPFVSLFRDTPAKWRTRGRHALLNMGIGLTNALLVAGVFVGLWAAVTAWAERHEFGLLFLSGATNLWRWALALVLLDAWTYFWHWLNHQVPFLWRFHRLHHADEKMDVTTANRFHFVEIMLSSLLRVPLLVLLGARLDELALYEILLFTVVQFQHANIGLPEPIDRVLRWVIVTPALHKVHHSVVRAEADSNYSSLFSWWDRIFGTWRLLPASRVIQFGVED